ncbi:MAG: hypothetical protein RhofKO_17800 [Rhodothermales bacterium]
MGREMMRNVLAGIAWMLVLATTSMAQHTFIAVVRVADTGAPLEGVNVVIEGTTQGGATDAEGRISIPNLAAGEYTFVFSYIGFETVERTVALPLAEGAVVEVRMDEAHEEEMEGIAVMATRTSRTIDDTPTRVEVIAGEEIEEKVAMEPSNITMLLNESPGIVVQPTSATSGNASIRIQGLDGRYTQLLRDGFPLYGGFSGGLSLLQVPPLDLYQVEIIKGPASTLYGGDAIAGLVNLVTKRPHEHPEASLLTNVTSAGGLDVAGWYAGRTERIGGTMLVSRNTTAAYDPDDDAFANLPETERWTVNPRLFFYGDGHTRGSVGLTYTTEDRTGGDLQAIENGPTATRSYLETNTSERLTAFVDGETEVAEGKHLTLKSSVSRFDRQLIVAGASGGGTLATKFEGEQLSSYSEASLAWRYGGHDLLVGLDLRTDRFQEVDPPATGTRDYNYASVGLFAQELWRLSNTVDLETGLRGEYHNTFGWFALPRASLLLRASPKLTTRVTAGLGYKAPTIFLEASEERAFTGIMPLPEDARAERSVGVSADFNYRTLLANRVALSLNQVFYATRLQSPLVPTSHHFGLPINLSYGNANGTVQTWGLETNAKFSLDDFKLFLGYVYLNAREDYASPGAGLPVDRAIPLTPAHKTYTVLVYEKHGTGRIGLEAYYTSSQELFGGAETDDYWVLGLMGQRRFGRLNVFLNFENFLDTKQSNFAPIIQGSPTDPQFAPIWAPMDGFIINGGIKLDLFAQGDDHDHH